MKGLEIKTTWNELITKVKQWFTDFVEDDMVFSGPSELRLIRQLRRRLARSKSRTYVH